MLQRLAGFLHSDASKHSNGKLAGKVSQATAMTAALRGMSRKMNLRTLGSLTSSGPRLT